MMEQIYRLGGIVVGSDLPLPVPPLEAVGVSAPVAIRLRFGPPLREPGALSSEHWEHWDLGISLRRYADGFLLRVPKWANFWIDSPGAEVTWSPIDDCQPSIIAQLFVDQILPLVFHVHGQFSFHASAVARERAVIAFVGRSGVGKSTLAASLASASIGGITHFGDDCLAVSPRADGILVHPSYAAARLWPESAGALFADRGELPRASPRTSKRRIGLTGTALPLLLRRIYLLEESDGAPEIVRLGRRDAFIALTSHVPRLDSERRERLIGELRMLQDVVSHVAVARLCFRRAFSDLPAVHRAIHADVALDAAGEQSPPS